MELTPNELKEIQFYQELSKENKKPVSEYHFYRRNFLHLKSLHNDCVNPFCVGYHGNEEDSFCPKCYNSLFKLRRVRLLNDDLPKDCIGSEVTLLHATYQYRDTRLYIKRLHENKEQIILNDSDNREYTLYLNEIVFFKV